MNRTAIALSLSLTAVLLAGVTTAQVFPSRWDDEGFESLASEISHAPGAAVMAGLRLTPQDLPPVACSASTEGYLYVQKDLTGTSDAYSSVLCWCTEDEVAGLGEPQPVYAYFSTGNQKCQGFFAE